MKYTPNDTYFDGFVQDCCNFIAGALKQGKSKLSGVYMTLSRDCPNICDLLCQK